MHELCLLTEIAYVAASVAAAGGGDCLTHTVN